MISLSVPRRVPAVLQGGVVAMTGTFHVLEEGSDENLEPAVAARHQSQPPAFGYAFGLWTKVVSFFWMLGLVGRALVRIAFRNNMGHLKLRVRLLFAALCHAPQVGALFRQGPPALQRIARERPETVIGPLLWPYLCASWSVEERLHCISDHYRIIGGLDGPFPFAVDERLVLATLDEVFPGLRVVIDQPLWLIREGGLTLSLFVEDFRAYSLAFSFMEAPMSMGIYCLIGSVQGRSTSDAVELYRQLTKAAHGLRPRDLLIELCRILCRHWEVKRLLGVRDSERYDRHPFFGGNTATAQDYDAIWQDRGGVLDSPYFYFLPLAAERRDEADIKPNKRSLYRGRYRFLDQLEVEVAQRLPSLQPQWFADR